MKKFRKFIQDSTTLAEEGFFIDQNKDVNITSWTEFFIRGHGLYFRDWCIEN